METSPDHRQRTNSLQVEHKFDGKIDGAALDAN